MVYYRELTVGKHQASIILNQRSQGQSAASRSKLGRVFAQQQLSWLSRVWIICVCSTVWDNSDDINHHCDVDSIDGPTKQWLGPFKITYGYAILISYIGPHQLYVGLRGYHLVEI